MSIEMEDRARMRRIDDAVIELVDNNRILDGQGGGINAFLLELYYFIV